ncbi:MAG: asparagine synthase (glutamine-hydrolyzing) [Candidatus Pacebacteria bacterium]|nr:asparagine synthase (glutamine-hydrolyzing) [Candidatus Paceibacterota bacterium]
MCGISGFNFNDRVLLKKMNMAVAHRGPDKEGVWNNADFSLGHRRLSIIDLSEKGVQPMFNENKTVAMVFNGEIYNYRELREELERKGHRFFSNTDSEAIIHLYEEKGERCLEHLDGIFSFGIYDLEKKIFFASRDPMGIKPFYYFCGGGKFIFSSEIKAILEHPVNREIDKRALSSYFHLFYPLAPLTIYKDIFKLPAGHFLIYKDGDVRIERYWKPSNKGKITDKNEIKKILFDLTEKAVEKQMISDRPLGVFLSGGIDSTAVAALAKKFSSGKLKTFSVGFESQEEKEKYNFDFEMARRVSRDFGTEHHEIMISGKDALSALEKVSWHMDEPISNHTQSITYLLSEIAKKEVAVVLGGDGGDEIFAGYPRYRLNLFLDKYQKIPVFLRKQILNKIISRVKNPDLARKIEKLPGVDRYMLFMSQKDEFLKQAIKSEWLEDKWHFDKFEKDYSRLSEFSSGETLMLMDLENWLPEESLMRTDKTTMAWGLEERVPLLDRHLVEFSFKIPDYYKINRSGGKKIFIEAMGSLLPDYVVNAPKRGWFSPMAKWLRSDLKEFAYEVLSPGYCSGGEEFLDFEAVRKILDDHISKRKYNLALIWSLITFQMWRRNFMRK